MRRAWERTARRAVVVWLLAATACAVNPATHRPELVLVSPAEERALGRELDGELLREGSIYEDGSLTAYVAGVGRHVARVSERADLAWTFRVLDEPAVNAFAAPAGYVYVARDLLALLHTEAELAAVLGHEVGHVAARHSARQITRAAMAARGVGLLRIVDPRMRHVAGLAAGVAQLSMLRHSRQQEIQADALGVRYLRGAGYPPHAMANVLGLLASLPNNGDTIPPWLSTHPDPNVRLELLSRDGIAPRAELPEPAFVAHLEGLVVGADPRRGYLEGERYVNPRAGFAVTFPRGWQVQQDAQVALALAPDGEVLAVAGASAWPDPREATEGFFAGGGLLRGATVAVRVGARGGLATAFVAPDPSGDLVGVATFLGADPLVMVVAFGTRVAWAQREAAAASIVSSVRDPTAREARVEPTRLEVRRLQAPATLRALDPEGPLEWLARLNRVRPDEELPPGRVVKLLRSRPQVEVAEIFGAGP